MRLVHGVRIALCLVALLAVQASVAAAVTITIRSGNAAPTAQDPPITYLVEPSGSCGTGFAAAFAPVDFAAASAGPLAWSVNPYSVWLSALPCDTKAHWISISANRDSRSALYAIPFSVDIVAPCCIHRATIDFCWASDDAIGDQPGFGPVINPSGVYLNGVALPISGVGYASSSQVLGVDITSLLVCGNNTLYVYNRDLGCAVAGVMFNAQINITECSTSTKSGTWGSIRKMYR